ncbi:peptidoglycan-binding protein LysM, partial [Lysobacter sp. 2RAB21]
FPHPPKAQFDYGRAQVLSVADLVRNGGPRDVIALSVGARDGIDNGTVFSTWRVGSRVPDRVKIGPDRSEDLYGKNSRVRLPDEFSGHAMVFRTFDKVSYALIMDGVRPTKVGYELKHPDSPY